MLILLIQIITNKYYKEMLIIQDLEINWNLIQIRIYNHRWV
jgi:hypothetical protein